MRPLLLDQVQVNVPKVAHLGNFGERDRREVRAGVQGIDRDGHGVCIVDHGYIVAETGDRAPPD